MLGRSLLVFLLVACQQDSNNPSLDTGGVTCAPSSEVCDGIDNDCDGEIDEDAEDAAALFVDADGDGFGDPGAPADACLIGGAPPDGYVADNTDCDDKSPEVFPGQEETCNLVDDDCSGTVDDDPVDGMTYYADRDQDGYGDPDDMVRSCDPIEGHGEDMTDCDDSDETVNPGAEEVCLDGVDNNCDGSEWQCSLDADSNASAAWYGQRPNEGDMRARVMDLNGDSIDDIVIGQPASSNDTGSINDGAAYVYYGPLSGDYALDESADARILAADASNHRLGERVHALSDIDGDGGDEVVMAAVQYASLDGGLLIYYSSTLAAAGTDALDDSDADITILGSATKGYLGASLFTGDVNDDDVADLLVGASNAPDSVSREGRVYLVDGDLAAGSHYVGDIADGYVTGEEFNDRLGQAGTAALPGDLNGDGIGDVLLGAPLNNEERGALYVFYGPLSGARVATDADVIYRDGESDTRFGRSVSAAGDLDGDGLDDFYVGVPRADDVETNVGIIYRISGSMDATDTDDTDEIADGRVIGVQNNEQLGAVMDSDADFTGDGTNDLLIGATSAGPLQEGRAYLFAGPVTGSTYSSSALLQVAGNVDSDKVGDRVDLTAAQMVISASGSDLVDDNAGAVYTFSNEMFDLP